MATQVGWAIVGDCGLYTGWRLTRRNMIAQHVSELWSGHKDFGTISEWCFGPRLSESQAAAWKRCQENGDRAVKVTITWQSKR